MHDLNYQLKNICSRNKDGSYSTQQNRHRLLQQAANQLHALGFRHLKTESLKPKHVEALVAHWKAEALTNAVMKNRMSALRWWMEKVNCRQVMSKDNSHYGIENRTYVTNEDKSRSVDVDQLSQVKDAYVRASLELQRVFGLRREEAIKFNAAFADQGDHIQLKGSWTKGGKARVVPIRNDEQRAVLDQVRRLSGKGSLIPPDKQYVEQMRIYERHTARAGLNKLHGLRHAYAQQRYQALVGVVCPAAGGPLKKELSVGQKALDKTARLEISKELGHEREQITAVYLGR
jgi:site-specific recombinase XerC